MTSMPLTLSTTFGTALGVALDAPVDVEEEEWSAVVAVVMAIHNQKSGPEKTANRKAALVVNSG
jgi:predicted protein tyrosine phosphatase